MQQRDVDDASDGPGGAGMGIIPRLWLILNTSSVPDIWFCNVVQKDDGRAHIDMHVWRNNGGVVCTTGSQCNRTIIALAVVCLRHCPDVERRFVLKGDDETSDDEDTDTKSAMYS
jgi:hypothetical protein